MFMHDLCVWNAQDCLRNCHEQIEATVRDSVCSSDVPNEAPPPSTSSADDDNDDNDEHQTTAAAASLPSTPTDVQDITLVSTA